MMHRWLLLGFWLVGCTSGATQTSQATPRETSTAGGMSASSPSTTDAALTIDDYLGRGMALLQQRQWRAAVEQGFDPALRLFEREYAEVGIVRGSRAGGATALLSLMQIAADQDTGAVVGAEWSDTMYLRAFCLIELGDTAAAEAQLRAALEVIPNDFLYSSELGHLQQAARQWQLALASFRAAKENVELLIRTTGPDELVFGQPLLGYRMRAMRGIGFSLYELGDLDGAEAIYREVLAINPNDAQVQHELALIAERRGSGE